MIKGLRYMVYMKRLSLFSFKKQRLLAAYSYLRGEYREDGGRVFLNTHCDRTGGNIHGRKTLSP